MKALTASAVLVLPEPPAQSPENEREGPLANAQSRGSRSGRICSLQDNPDKARYPEEDYNQSHIEHLKNIGRVVHKAGDV